jgi:hypothetical protein
MIPAGGRGDIEGALPGGLAAAVARLSRVGPGGTSPRHGDGRARGPGAG